MQNFICITRIEFHFSNEILLYIYVNLACTRFIKKEKKFAQKWTMKDFLHIFTKIMIDFFL